MKDKTTVLVIDDSPQLCESLKLGLELRHGFEVLAAQDGKTGLRMARELAPDVIVLDVMMPGLSGGQVAEQLREFPGTARTPILFLTGMISKAEVEENGGIIGGERFLAKPVGADELAHAINGLLAARGTLNRAPKRRGADL